MSQHTSRCAELGGCRVEALADAATLRAYAASPQGPLHLILDLAEAAIAGSYAIDPPPDGPLWNGERYAVWSARAAFKAVPGLREE